MLSQGAGCSKRQQLFGNACREDSFSGGETPSFERLSHDRGQVDSREPPYEVYEWHKDSKYFNCHHEPHAEGECGDQKLGVKVAG